MNKILIIGASGFLGSKLFSKLKNKHKVVGTYNKHKVRGLLKLDTTNKNALKRFFQKHDPDIVINTVGLNNIRVCENNKKLAKKINYTSAKNISQLCKNRKLIYISTIYVFSGKKRNYSEKHIPHPVNYYGKTHLMAEKESLKIKNSIVIRSDLLYGYNGKNRNNSFLSNIIKGKKINLNNEQIKHPLFIDDAAYAIQLMIKKDLSGIFHLAGPDKTNKYQIGIRFEKLIRKKSVITPITQSQQKVPRPKNTTINTKKARKHGIKFHSLDSAFRIIKKSL